MKDVDKLPLVALAMVLVAINPRCSPPDDHRTTGPWLLSPANQSDSVLAVEPDNQLVQLAHRTGEPNQQWRVRQAGSVVAIESGTGRCLTANTSKVATAVCSDDDKAQQWRRDDNRLRNLGTGTCLSTRDADATTIIRVSCDTAPAWQLTPIVTSSTPSTT